MVKLWFIECTGGTVPLCTFLKFIVSAKSAKSARNNSSLGKSTSPRTLFFYLSQITQMTQIISA